MTNHRGADERDWPQRILDAVHRAVVITALLVTVLLGVHKWGAIDADQAQDLQITTTINH